MPVTKQAIKRIKQANVKTASNKHYNSHMKSMIKLFLDYVNKGEGDKAEKVMAKVASSIDTCAKKKVIHGNNADHKKSRLSRALNNLKKAAPKAKAEKKVEKAEEKEAPKAEKKEK